MNYSQKAARAFEIAGYILLVPALFGVAASMFIIWFAVFIWAIFIFGCVLLVGYFKHSRGRLEKKRVLLLWIGTAALNGFLLIASLWIAWLAFRYSPWDFFAAGEVWSSPFFSFALILVYSAAVAVAVKAYFFEKNQGKYL